MLPGELPLFIGKNTANSTGIYFNSENEKVWNGSVSIAEDKETYLINVIVIVHGTHTSIYTDRNDDGGG